MKSEGRKLLPVLLALILLEMAFFAFYGVSRHYNFLTSINDLGHMDQAIWGTLHGQPFLNTDVFNFAVSRLGIHFDPILLLFVPLYWIVPSVHWLILAQAIVLPLAALPIFYLARQVLSSDWLAFFWSLTYLFSPLVLSAAAWDFHPVSLAVPFIALGFLGIEQKRFGLLLLSCCFILLCKEHFGLLVFGFALLWYSRNRKAGKAFALALLGIGHLFLVIKVVMPLFSPSSQHPMLSQDMGTFSRYGWLGSSLEGIVRKLVLHPFETLRHALIAMGGWAYLALLLIPLFCLPLLGGEFLLPGMADLLANLLSANPMPRSIFSYHSVTLIPVMVVAAIYGSRRLGRVSSAMSPLRQVLAILGVTLILGWNAFPFFSLPGGQGFWAPKNLGIFPEESFAKTKRLISQEMKLSVQANIGAHFTQRKEIFIFPEQIDAVDAVVLRLDSPTLLSPGHGPHQIGSLGHHLQASPLEYLDTVERMLERENSTGVFWYDPWLILIKGAETSPAIDDIMNKINSLRKEWKEASTFGKN